MSKVNNKDTRHQNDNNDVVSVFVLTLNIYI